MAEVPPVRPSETISSDTQPGHGLIYRVRVPALPHRRCIHILGSLRFHSVLFRFSYSRCHAVCRRYRRLLSGLRAGFVASVTALIAHTFVLRTMGMQGWFVVTSHEPLGHVCILLIGPALGRLRSIGQQLSREIDRRKSYQNATQSSEKQHRSMIEMMSEGLLHVDNDDNILFCNSQMGQTPRVRTT